MSTPAWIANVDWLSSASRSPLRAAVSVTAAPAIRWVAAGSVAPAPRNWDGQRNVALQVRVLREVGNPHIRGHDCSYRALASVQAHALETHTAGGVASTVMGSSMRSCGA